MMLYSLIFVLSLPLLAYADVHFTSPLPGQSVVSTLPLTISWEESGDPPSISQLLSYQLTLCVGGNDSNSIIPVSILVRNGNFSEGNQLNVTLGPDVPASDTKELYFVKMHSVIRNSGTVTNYSPRFNLLFGSALRLSTIRSFPDTNLCGPPTELTPPSETRHVEFRKRQEGDPFAVPWSLQLGGTKYAPMQSFPPSKITKSQPTPQYPPSKVALATTPLPPNTVIQTTITQGLTWTFTQQQNQQSGLPESSVDLNRFLRRWRD